MKKTLTGLVIVLALAVCSNAAFAALLKSPYLIYPGNNTTMEVLWQDTQTETTNQVCWGTTTSYSTCQTVPENSPTANQHIYTITGLTPNTLYYYQVSDQTNGVYGTGSFLTAPVTGATSVNFLAFGDTRTDPTALDAVMAEMNKVIANNPTYQGLTVHAGDWVSSDGESNWTNEWFAPSLVDATAFRLLSPIDGVKGNHENPAGSAPNYGTSQFFPKYYPFPWPNMGTFPAGTSTAPDKCYTAGLPCYNGLYWSFDYGPVHFTMVDQYTYYAPGTPQGQWILNDLTNARNNPNTPWTILMYHEPAWTCGDHTDSPYPQQYLDSIIGGMVDLVIAGHSHNYCRTEVWNSAQANGDSIVPTIPYITSGGGGAPLGGVNLTNQSSWKHVVVGDNDFNYSTFNVNGNTLTMSAYQVNNASLTTLPSASSPTSSSLIETLVLNHFTNVTSQVSVQVGNIAYSRATKTYVSTVTITNNGAALTGNIDLVLNGLLALQQTQSNGTVIPGVSAFNPAAADPQTGQNGSGPATTVIATGNGLITNVTLTNATGQSNGAPVITFSTSGLANGASVTVPLTFSNPSNGQIVYLPQILQE
jgi:hypothetical protein